MESLIAYLVVGVIGFAAIGLIFVRLVRKPPKGIAFIRTGFRPKVIKDGIGIFIPGLNDCMEVNLKSMRLPISKNGESSLTTADYLLADVDVDFYLRCKADSESIMLAADKLGISTMDPDELKGHVESKFEDAIRNVAATMDFEDLHRKRGDFCKKVLEVTNLGLAEIGFELEDVAMTKLAETPGDFYKDNIHNTEGRALQVARIAEKAKHTNKVERDKELEIERQNLEAAQERLQIQRDREYAELEQAKEIAKRNAAQRAEIAAEESEKEKEAEEIRIRTHEEAEDARIQSAKRLAQKRIESERAVEEEQIHKAKAIESENIAKERELQLARIEQQKALESENIAKLKEIELAEILRQQAQDLAQEETQIKLTEAARKKEEAQVLKKKQIELAEQQRAIEVANASREKSESEAAADAAKALAVEEAQKVITVQEVAIAERQKQIEVLEAAKVAEQSAIAQKVSAEAEKLAAEDRAEAKRISAQAQADEILVTAKARTDADSLEVEVAQKRYEADAEGKRKLHEAENALSDKQIQMKEKLDLIAKMPEILREMNKPIEKIDSIKIFQTDHLGGGGVSPVVTTDKDGKPVAVQSSGNDNMMGRLADALLEYKVKSPVIDTWLQQFGFASTNPQDLVGGLIDPKTKPNGSASPHRIKPKEDIHA